MPVTPAAPGPWQIGSIGSNSPWAVPGTFSAHCPPSPSLLDQATLSRFTSSSPVPLLFHFTTFVTVHISIPFAALGKGSQRQPLPLPNADHHHNTILDRSRRVFPPRSSSEAAKASITPSLATDDQGKLFYFLYFGICREGGSVVWACFITTTLGFASTRVAATGSSGQRVETE